MLIDFSFVIPSQTLFQGELEHRRVKRFYVRTNKTLSFTRQITKHERRERVLERIRQGERARQSSAPATSSEPPRAFVPFTDSEPLPKTSPEVHSHISHSKRARINIFQWLEAHAGDDALRVRPVLSFVSEFCF